MNKGNNILLKDLTSKSRWFMSIMEAYFNDYWTKEQKIKLSNITFPESLFFEYPIKSNALGTNFTRGIVLNES